VSALAPAELSQRSWASTSRCTPARPHRARAAAQTPPARQLRVARGRVLSRSARPAARSSADRRIVAFGEVGPLLPHRTSRGSRAWATPSFEMLDTRLPAAGAGAALEGPATVDVIQRRRNPPVVGRRARRRRSTRPCDRRRTPTWSRNGANASLGVAYAHAGVVLDAVAAAHGEVVRRGPFPSQNERAGARHQRAGRDFRRAAGSSRRVTGLEHAVRARRVGDRHATEDDDEVRGEPLRAAAGGDSPTADS